MPASPIVGWDPQRLFLEGSEMATTHSSQEHIEPGSLAHPGTLFVLRLYVSGASPRSLEAIKNVKTICDEHLAGRYRLNVVDIYQEPERAARDQIVAVPMLVIQLPLPVRRLIGTLTNTAQVRQLFGLGNSADPLAGSGQEQRPRDA
jgi:circadian clock protein KaiB